MLALTPVFAATLLAQVAALSPPEQRLRDWITEHREEQTGYLARIVDIPSGTMNFAGVRRVADALRVTLKSLAHAGEVSFIAPFVAAAMDGLGAGGTGSHSPDEHVNLDSMVRQTERAAVLVHRLLETATARSALKP